MWKHFCSPEGCEHKIIYSVKDGGHIAGCKPWHRIITLYSECFLERMLVPNKG